LSPRGSCNNSGKLLYSLSLRNSPGGRVVYSPGSDIGRWIESSRTRSRQHRRQPATAKRGAGGGGGTGKEWARKSFTLFFTPASSPFSRNLKRGGVPKSFQAIARQLADLIFVVFHEAGQWTGRLASRATFPMEWFPGPFLSGDPRGKGSLMGSVIIQTWSKFPMGLINIPVPVFQHHTAFFDRVAFVGVIWFDISLISFDVWVCELLLIFG